MNIKDYTGQKYWKLTFTKPTDKRDSKRRYVIWEVKCDCGNTAYAIPSRVIQGHRKSCGCLNTSEALSARRKGIPNENKKDFTGRKHYRLTYLAPTDKRSSAGSVVWQARCDCGTIVYSVPKFYDDGCIKSCGCLNKETHVARGKENRKYDPMISAARSVWGHTYKDGCDFDTFYRLSQLPCDYCGCSPYRVYNRLRTEGGDFTYNGLDRVDSSKGHTPDNLVPCCYTCNKMKSNMTRDEFISHIRRIRTHLCL